MSQPAVPANRSPVVSDLLASVVVFLVALPLCMGIAIACGLSPATGLISGMIGGLLVGTIAGSPLTVTGPAAGLVVLVWEIVQDFGLVMLGPIVAGAGILQIAGGLLGIGRWFRAISPAVVNGMLAGIGVLIFASQFHVMLDDKPKASGIMNLLSIPEAIYAGIFPIDGSPHELAAVTGILTIVSIILWNRYKPKSLGLIPGALVGVVVATALATILGWNINKVDLPASLLDAVNIPKPDVLPGFLNGKVLFAILGLAFVASAESLLSAVAVDRMHQGPRTNFDRELIAQGVGNATAGVLGALPVTGVIVRSSANVQAGAKTRRSTIFHGAWLVILVVALPWILEWVPTSALAAVLVLTGFKLVDVDNARNLANYGWIPFAIYMATVGGIVAFDLLTGVLIGVAMTVVKLLFKVTRLWVRVEPGDGKRVDIYVEGAATFVRLPTFAHALERIPPGTEVHMHIQRLLYIDHSCMDLLKTWERQQAETGTRLIVEWAELNQRYHAPMNQPAAA